MLYYCSPRILVANMENKHELDGGMKSKAYTGLIVFPHIAAFFPASGASVHA